MKSVMISIKPKWCKLIASGKKTVEVRKNRPKIETPFKGYIYCTKAFYYKGDGYFQGKYCGKVIGEFVCDFVNEYTAEFTDGNYHEDIRQIFEDGEVIIASNEDENPNNCFLCNRACLSFGDIKKYIGTNFHEKPFYGWHISDLVIYDRPKGLSEFRHCGDNYHFNPIVTNPPQSWCYCEETNY